MAAGPALSLKDGLTRAANLVAIGEQRPRGIVSIWKLSRGGWTLRRRYARPVEVKALRTIARGDDELLEFTPAGGRGGPMVCASPALLDAWRAAPPLR